jgi:hypothetical protein
MNKNTTIVILFLNILFLFGIIIYLWFFVGLKSSDHIVRNNTDHESTQQLLAAKKLCLYKIIEENVIIDTSSLLLDTNNNLLHFENLFLTDTLRYFLYIPSGGCHSCLSEVKHEILQYGGESFYEKMVFITSFIAGGKLDKIIDQYHLPIYYIKDKYLGFLSERENLYFIFAMDKMGNTSRYHILDGNLTQISAQYFKYCKNF